MTELTRDECWAIAEVIETSEGYPSAYYDGYWLADYLKEAIESVIDDRLAGIKSLVAILENPEVAFAFPVKDIVPVLKELLK